MRKDFFNLMLFLFVFFVASCSVMIEDFSELTKFSDYEVKCYSMEINSDEIDYDTLINPVISVNNGNPFAFEPVEINGFEFIKKEVIKISKNFYEVRCIYTRGDLPSDEAFYEVKIYFENGKTGEEVLDSNKSFITTGKIGTEISYEAESVSGYLEPVVTKIPSLQANTEGSPYQIVKVFYERASVTYSFNVNGGKWSDETDSVKNISGKIDSDVIFAFVPVKEDYVFLDWSPLVPAYFGDSDIEFTAQWKNPSSANNSIQDIYSGDIKINIEKTVAMKKFRATCVPPYADGNFIYTWIFDGKDLGVKTNSFESDELLAGEHNIFVSVTDGNSVWTLTEKVVIE